MNLTVSSITKSFWSSIKENSTLLSILIIIGTGIYQLFPLLFGERPISGDHSAHLVKAWQLKDMLFNKGELYTWSDMWLTGYPVNYHYSFLSELLTVFFSCLVKNNDLNTAYSYAVIFSWILPALGIFFFAHRLGNNLTGILAALFMMTFPGEHPLGGWMGALEMGVWPCYLSVGLGILAIHFLFIVSESASLKDAAIAGLLCGLALLSHTLQLFNLTIASILIILCLILRKDFVKADFSRYVILAILILAIAICIAAPFYLPLISTSQYLMAAGSYWSGFYELLFKLIQGRLLPRMSILLAIMGVFGIAYALVSNNYRAWFCGLAICLWLAISANDIGVALLNYLSRESTARIEFARFAMILMPFLCTLAAWVLSTLIIYCLKQYREQFKTESRTKTFLSGLLALSFSAVYFYAFLSTNINIPLKLLGQRQNVSEIKSAISFLNQKATEDPRFYRIGVDIDPDPLHVSLDLSMQLTRPIYTITYTPAVNFVAMGRGGRMNMTEYANIKYYLSRSELNNPNYKKIWQAENLRIYELLDFSDQRFDIAGSGTVKEISRNEREIVLESSGDASGLLRLHMSEFSRWKATLNGKNIETRPFKVDFRLTALEVPLSPGRYVFSFRLAWPEIIAPWMCLLGLFTSLVIIVRESEGLSIRILIKNKKKIFIGILYSFFSLITLVVICKKTNALRIVNSDLSVESITQNWGNLELNKSVSGATITLLNTKFKNGFGSHAPSRIKLKFNGTFKTFSGICGIDAECGRGALNCSIESNGKTLFQSKNFVVGGDAQTFNVDIQGLSGVDLILSGIGNDTSCAHGDWADLNLQ